MSFGKVIPVIGATGEGKTYWVKSVLRKTKNEKFTFSLIAGDYNKECKMITNFTEFLHLISTKTNCVFVVDEAYVVLPQSLNPEAKKLHRIIAEALVNARKLNNIVIFVFHQFRQLPGWLVGYSNFVIRFNSNDQFEVQARRFASYENLYSSLFKYPKIKKDKKIIIDTVPVMVCSAPLQILIR